MNGHMDQLSQSGWIIRQVDPTKEPQLAKRRNVNRLPSLVILKQGKEVDRLVGKTPTTNSSNDCHLIFRPMYLLTCRFTSINQSAENRSLSTNAANHSAPSSSPSYQRSQDDLSTLPHLQPHQESFATSSLSPNVFARASTSNHDSGLQTFAPAQDDLAVQPASFTSPSAPAALCSPLFVSRSKMASSLRLVLARLSINMAMKYSSSPVDIFSAKEPDAAR